jgi:hypothetical protein
MGGWQEWSLLVNLLEVRYGEQNWAAKPGHLPAYLVQILPTGGTRLGYGVLGTIVVIAVIVLIVRAL